MQPLDPHTLFSIFEQGDEEVYREHNQTEALKNPFVLMGMVVRGVENYYMMDMMYLRHYPDAYKKVRKMIQYKYYNRLYGYLLIINSMSFEDIYAIGESFNTKEVDRGLYTLLYYFEDIEEYEKCAIIKRYRDLLQKKSNSKVASLI